MKFISKKIILCGFIYLYAAMTCNAQSKDSIAGPADYSLLPVQHIRLQTSNPAAYFDVEGDRMNGQIIYNHTSGDYRYISDPQSMNSGKIEAEGFKRVNKLHFYGKFSYEVAGLNGQKWKDVLMPSQNNPFILGDSIGGDYDNEYFSIKGAVASSINEKIRWGISLDYNGGSSADQTDPRPKIDAMRFSVCPGVMYNLSNWNFGLDLMYERYREDISITSVESTNTHYFFRFQGLGNYYPDSGTGFRREYRGNTFGGNIQIGWKKNTLENIIQFGYKNKEEKAGDGSPTADSSGALNLFKAGDYKETTYSLMNIFSLKRDQTSHIIKLKVDYSPSNKGTWYDQQRVANSNKSNTWEVYNTSVKYKNKRTDAGLDYIWLKEKEGLTDYMLGCSVELEQNKTTFLPEMYLQKYTNIKISAKGGKTFWLPKRFQLGLGMNVSYQKNLSSNAEFEGIALADIYSYPVFEYLTSDYYTGSASVKLSKRTILGNLPSMIYFTTNINYAQSTLNTDNFDKPHRIGITASVGFTF